MTTTTTTTTTNTAAMLHTTAQWTAILASAIGLVAMILGVNVSPTEAASVAGIIIALVTAAAHVHGKAIVAAATAAVATATGNAPASGK